jgi:hypothetical protein
MKLLQVFVAGSISWKSVSMKSLIVMTVYVSKKKNGSEIVSIGDDENGNVG